VPALGAADPLPFRPRRVLVGGTSGSGKSTLARRLGELLDAPYQELDALYHGPGWTPRSTFVEEVDAFSAEPAWVTEWQYAPVRPMMVERADLMVFLLFSRTVVMRRMVRRTVQRRLARQQLWNGNTEPPFRTILHDPEHIIRWAWRTHRLQWGRHDMLAEHDTLFVVGIRSPRELESWIAGPLAAALAD